MKEFKDLTVLERHSTCTWVHGLNLADRISGTLQCCLRHDLLEYFSSFSYIPWQPASHRVCGPSCSTDFFDHWIGLGIAFNLVSGCKWWRLSFKVSWSELKWNSYKTSKWSFFYTLNDHIDLSNLCSLLNIQWRFIFWAYFIVTCVCFMFVLNYKPCYIPLVYFVFNQGEWPHKAYISYVLWISPIEEDDPKPWTQRWFDSDSFKIGLTHNPIF